MALHWPFVAAAARILASVDAIHSFFFLFSLPVFSRFPFVLLRVEEISSRFLKVRLTVGGRNTALGCSFEKEILPISFSH